MEKSIFRRFLINKTFFNYFQKGVNFLRLLECKHQTRILIALLLVLISLTKYSRVSRKKFQGSLCPLQYDLGSSANFVGVIDKFFIR